MTRPLLLSLILLSCSSPPTSQPETCQAPHAVPQEAGPFACVLGSSETAFSGRAMTSGTIGTRRAGNGTSEKGTVKLETAVLLQVIAAAIDIAAIVYLIWIYRGLRSIERRLRGKERR